MNDDVHSPSGVRVCTVLFRWDGTHLQMALNASASLPSAEPETGDDLESTAQRLIEQVASAPPHYTEQLYTFSESTDRGRQILVSYIGLFPPVHEGQDDAGTLIWRPVAQGQPTGDVDRRVCDYALVRLRAKLGYTNIAFYLMPPEFSLSELQTMYESILDETLDKRNFRRRMVSSGNLVDTGAKRRDGSHRPASLYRFTPHADHGNYLTPTWQRS